MSPYAGLLIGNTLGGAAVILTLIAGHRTTKRLMRAERALVALAKAVGTPAAYDAAMNLDPEWGSKAVSGWEIIEWRDLDFLARVKAENHHLEFEVYEVTSWESWLNGVHQPGPHFERADGDSNWDSTLDITEAEYLFHGSVKWDGCSNWSWNTDTCMWHGCGMGDVMKLAEAMKRAYLLTPSRVEGFDADLPAVKG